MYFLRNYKIKTEIQAKGTTEIFTSKNFLGSTRNNLDHKIDFKLNSFTN